MINEITNTNSKDNLDEAYWQNRYLNKETGWDVGEITTPLKEYFDQLNNKELKILIPGAGNGHEAIYLHNQGFKNVYVVDLAKAPLENISKAIPDFPKHHLIHENFFDHSAKYDLIIEQTFFCALDPTFRPAYAKKMSELLNKDSKLAGLLFDTEFEGGPPFGGKKEDYRAIFTPYFEFRVFEKCYNSIKPRQNRELFMILRNK